jgi:DNA-binding transcriptional regulator YdaS (Cro superfamily)
MDTDTQLELFAHAVEALGGQRSAARAIDISERNLARLMKGERRLHAGILEDICKALIAHADRCKVLERQLSPPSPPTAPKPRQNRRYMRATTPRARHQSRPMIRALSRPPASLASPLSRTDRHGADPHPLPGRQDQQGRHHQLVLATQRHPRTRRMEAHKPGQGPQRRHGRRRKTQRGSQNLEGWRHQAPQIRTKAQPATFGALIDRYRREKLEGKKPNGQPLLREKTRAVYETSLKRLEFWAGKHPVTYITPLRVRALRDANAKPIDQGAWAMPPRSICCASCARCWTLPKRSS